MSTPGRERSIDETIGLVATEGGVADACQEVESWAKSGRAVDLAALAAVLEARCPAGGDESQKKQRGWFETVADHVEDQLALTPGAAAVDALLGLSLETRTRSVTMPRERALRIRSFASRLGFGQTPQTFLEALDRFGGRREHQELLACWMHEVVLRGTSLDDGRANLFRRSLAAAKHPLAALPLALRPTEREAPSYMPLYGDKGLGRAIERLTSGAMSIRTVPPPADGGVVRTTRRDEPEVTARMLAALQLWAKTEAKVFDVQPAIDGGALGSWLLRALPLDSTTGAARLDCSRTGAEGVFGPLFSAASNGGAYTAGLGGAYGRRAAWTSLEALTGAPAGAEVSEIEALADRSTFLTFRSPGPWFFDVAWDIGALVLRPDGRSVAVLAATDND
jgi:hypothetical protein